MDEAQPLAVNAGKVLLPSGYGLESGEGIARRIARIPGSRMMSVSGSSEVCNRDKAIIALVSCGHGASHLMQLAIPPLFPILHGVFGASFTELGLVTTLLFVASGFRRRPLHRPADAHAVFLAVAVTFALAAPTVMRVRRGAQTARPG
jgi:hypothetical protein